MFLSYTFPFVYSYGKTPQMLVSRIKKEQNDKVK